MPLAAPEVTGVVPVGAAALVATVGPEETGKRNISGVIVHTATDVRDVVLVHVVEAVPKLNPKQPINKIN